jgi:hypothetical protein
VVNVLLVTKQITGKAMMLEEIINYVQSLQRQVEVSKLLNLLFGISVNEYLRLTAEASKCMFVVAFSVPLNETLSYQS